MLPVSNATVPNAPARWRVPVDAEMSGQQTHETRTGATDSEPTSCHDRAVRCRPRGLRPTTAVSGAASCRRQRGVGVRPANAVLALVRRRPGGGPDAAPCVVGDNTHMRQPALLILTAAVLVAFATWRTWPQMVWHCPGDDPSDDPTRDPFHPDAAAPRSPVSPPVRHFCPAAPLADGSAVHPSLRLPPPVRRRDPPN